MHQDCVAGKMVLRGLAAFAHTWDHEQHRLDLDEAVGIRLACDAAVQLTKHQHRWQGKHKQGAKN